MAVDIDQIVDSVDPPPADEIQIDNASGKGKLTAYARQRMTEVELLQWAGLDPRVWQVTKLALKAWDGYYKFGATGEEDHRVVDLYSHHAEIRRRFNEDLISAVDLLAADFPRMWSPPELRPKSNGDLCYVISLFDVHFGKYCWAGDSGSNYNLNEADRVYRQAVVDLLEKVPSGGVAKIVFPIGQDFGHFDNANNATTKGTIVDSDGRWAKVYKAMKLAVIWAVEQAARVAPVEIRYSGGNHDRLVSYTLCELIESLFSRDPRVDVTQATNALSRQYLQWGCTAIGITHGDGAKASNKDLPLIMARECKFWSECDHHEILTGHLHHQQVLEKVGVVVRILPSLSGTDWYHYHNGWTCNVRAAQGLLYDHDAGITAIHYAHAE